MKRFFAKTTIFVLLTLILAVTLTACKPSEGTETSSTEQQTTEPPKPLVLAEGGEFNFKVISGGTKLDESSLNVYTRLVSQMRDLLDVGSIKTGTDRTPESEENEILFGFTSYEQSKQIFGDIGFSEYAVATVGNKIVIAGYDSNALYSAVADFVDYLRENVKDGRVEIPHDLLLTGKSGGKTFPLIYSGNVPSLSGFEMASFSPCGDDYEQITYTKSSLEAFNDYKTRLTSAGFSLYAENNIADNPFATFVKDALMVHTYFINHSGEVKVIIAEDALLPSAEEVTYTKKCEPTFTLLGCAVGSKSNVGGLGCIIGLEDGTFIVIDGGYNTSYDSRTLYQKLKELSPDKNNIVIRAWFVTHAHSDHYGNLVNFSKTYSKNYGVTVESFMYNFCNTQEQTQYSSSGSFTSVTNTVLSYWKDSKVYKCLTGQVYKFAGCEMEILYCMSDFLPKIIGTETTDADKNNVDGNTQNVTVRFKMAGQTIMVTGDATKINLDEMCDRYGEELKSDMITVPHHGHNEDRYRARNGTKEFYNLTDPETVFWPAADSDYDQRSRWDGTGTKFEVNYYLLNLLHVKKTIVAGSTPKTVTLPYKP